LYTEFNFGSCWQQEFHNPNETSQRTVQGAFLVHTGNKSSIIPMKHHSVQYKVHFGSCWQQEFHNPNETSQRTVQDAFWFMLATRIP